VSNHELSNTYVTQAANRVTYVESNESQFWTLLQVVFMIVISSLLRNTDIRHSVSGTVV